MIVFNKNRFGPKYETLKTFGLASVGVVMAMGKVGLIEPIRHRRLRGAQAARNLSASAVHLAATEPSATQPLHDGTTAPVIELPITHNSSDFRLSA